MHRSLILAAVMVLLSSRSPAQTVKVELWADPSQTSCELVDHSVALISVYVVQTGNAQSTLVRFKAPKPECMVGATWVGDMTSYVGVGSSQTDLAIAYGQCKTLPLVACQINYFAAGGSLPCCVYAPQATPPTYYGYPTFTWVDCSFGEHLSSLGQSVVINPDASCRCMNPLATENATWGRVKSLYR